MSWATVTVHGDRLPPDQCPRAQCFKRPMLRMSGFEVKEAPAEKMDKLVVPQKPILLATRPRVFKGLRGSAGGTQRNWTTLGLGRLW